MREFKAVSGPSHATIYIFVWIYECVYTGAKTGFERMRVAFARYRWSRASGKPEVREERAEKVSSLHIDDLKDAMEEMGTEQVEEERKTFTITGKSE